MQSVILSMGEKPAIIRKEMAYAPYEAAGVVTDGVLTKRYSCERGRSQVLKVGNLERNSISQRRSEFRKLEKSDMPIVAIILRTT